MRFVAAISLTLIVAACAAPKEPAPSPTPMLVSHIVTMGLDQYRTAIRPTGRGAFAVSLDGTEYFWDSCPGTNCGNLLPKSQALLNCELKAQDDCRLAMTDDVQLIPFVQRPLDWKPEPPPAPPPPLSGKEIVASLVGHNISGKIAGYGPFQTEIKPDGSFAGEGRGDISGRWSISVDRFCIDAMNGQTLNLCAHVAIGGNKLWLIGDDDRLRQFYKVTLIP